VIAPDGRYSMFVPGDWVEVAVGLSEITYRSPDATSTMILSVSREELVDIRRPQAYAEAGRRSVTAIYSNVLTLSMTPVQVGGIEAYRWIYTATVSGSERLFYQLFLIDGNEGFVVTGFAPATVDFGTTQALFDSMAGSINFARGSSLRAPRRSVGPDQGLAPKFLPVHGLSERG
jgi:hypothetical protein